MRKILLFLSFGLAILFLIVSAFVFQQETKKLAQLRNQTPVKVKIIQVDCRRRKKGNQIVFNWKGKEYFKYIHTNSEKCKVLQKQQYIQIKVDTKGKIIFANEAYNGSLNSEIYAKISVGLLIGWAMIYYLVYPHKRY